MAIKELLADGLDYLDNGRAYPVTPYYEMYTNEGLRFWVAEPWSAFKVVASIHHKNSEVQQATDSSSSQTLIITTQTKINAPNDKLLVIDYDGIKYAIQEQDNFYKTSDTWHYVGFSLPYFMGDVIDDSRLNVLNILGDCRSLFISDLITRTWPVYSAYNVPRDLTPPYMAIDVKDTRAIQSSPIILETGQSDQLVYDTIELTSYGLPLSKVIDYRNALHDDFAFSGFGVSSIGDIKSRTTGRSTAFNSTSAGHSITMTINYYQESIPAIMRKLILSAHILVTH